MKKAFLKEYFSIPNLMGYFRILLVPIYLYVYINAESKSDYYVAAGIMVLSFLTDLFDGKIARKFDMVTEFGKFLDPVADKITQGVLAISFAFRYPIVAVLVVIFIIKEFTMLGVGIFFYKKGKWMNGAQMHGKICTTVLDVTMFILLIFPTIPYVVVTLLTVICIGFVLVSFWKYIKTYIKMWNELKEGNQAATV